MRSVVARRYRRFRRRLRFPSSVEPSPNLTIHEPRLESRLLPIQPRVFVAITDVAQYAHLSESDMEALGAELDTIRRDIEDSLGAHDAT